MRQGRRPQSEMSQRTRRQPQSGGRQPWLVNRVHRHRVLDGRAGQVWEGNLKTKACLSTKQEEPAVVPRLGTYGVLTIRLIFEPE